MSASNARTDAWSALAPERPRAPGVIAAILARNAIPLIGMLWFGWSVAQFLLLTVFNFGLTIGNIGLSGVTAMTLRGEDGRPPGRIGIGQGLNLLVATAFISLLLTVMGGWPIFVVSGVDTMILREPALWWSALAMELSAAPAVWAEVREKARLPLSPEQIKKRDQPRVGAAFLGVGASMVLSGWAAKMGVFGSAFLVIAFTAFALLRELRPDWIHEFLRPKDMPPR